MNHLCVLLPCLMALAVPLRSFAGEETQAKPHRVVIEVTDEGKEGWDAMLNNVENLQKAFGNSHSTIEVVAHGKGLGLLLKGSAVEERLSKVAATGVVFAACENSMRKKNVTKEMLLPAATTTDSGVTEVVRKQEAGWSYLKSGS